MTGIVDLDFNTHAVHIETPRLILREHRPEDLEPLYAILSDPAATWYIPDMRKVNPDETEAYLRSAMRDADRNVRLRYNLAVEDRATGELLGAVGLHVIDGTPEGAHYGLGYFLRPESWNRGYATEAAHAALGFIFNGNACRVSASCLAENLGSRRVAEKCGMTQEGLLVAHTWHDGQWKDCVVYRLLRDEFKTD
ncbi:MAG: GNAT family N-acetyltransferase [Clostridia bacterium]|nr:GNAT family N-acetyltransferase [Clostridia bacterium]